MKFLFFPLLFICLIVLAQPADIQAKSAFLAAQDAYGNGDYAKAIEKLDQVKKLLGSTNPRVEHLLANAYFENEEYDKAQASLHSYFELAADSDVNYLQMVRMVEAIKEAKAAFAFKSKIDEIKLMSAEELWVKREEIQYSLAPFDTPAGFVKDVPPNYPAKAVSMDIIALIITLISIDESGIPAEIIFLKEHPLFKSAVSKAIQVSTFAPAKMEGKSVKGWILKKYNFGMTSQK